MKGIRRIFRELRLSRRSYALVFPMIAFFILSFLFPVLFDAAFTTLIFIIFAIVADGILLFRHADPVSASRTFRHNRLSNGDVNEVMIRIVSYLGFAVKVKIIDELPVQLQERRFSIPAVLQPGQEKTFSYEVRPVERGEYHFGVINLLLRSTIAGLCVRHIRSGEKMLMACYPSFLRLRQFELLAISNRLAELGIKKIRKIGHSTEFEQIKEYVSGDDVRTINWKATARRSQLMVNHFRDERAQQVYCIIDTGRIMKMPFKGMTLLDYSVNASLVIGHVVWAKQDKPGLATFSDRAAVTVTADRRGNQMLRLQEALYNAGTGFEETSYESLLSTVRTKIRQRSLLMIFSNFETLSGLQRQIGYLRKLSTQHLVVVILFENTELRTLLDERPHNTFAIYEQTIAQKFEYEKRQIIRELRKFGILTVYTAPENLTINALNKYLEIKTRGLI